MNSEQADPAEVVSERVVNAPRELVYAAWTEPDHLSAWWGPKGFVNTFHECEAKPGGIWRFDMKAPDGRVFPNKSIFKELVKPERIVFEHLEPVHWFRATATFEAEGGRTRVRFGMWFESAAECEQVRRFIVEGNEQNFDRLEAELARMSVGIH